MTSIGPSVLDLTQFLTRERERRATLGLPPLLQMEASTQAGYKLLVETLFTRAGDRYVVGELDRRHQDYLKQLAPRLKPLTDRARDFHSAVARARTNLTQGYQNLSQAGRDELDRQVKVLDDAEATVRDQSRTVTRKLASVVRRGRIRRVVLEGLHAVVLLLLFTFGFGWVGESACRWVADAFGQPPFPDSTCVLIWAVVTILLFVLERWFLGPRIDHVIDAWIERNTADTLGQYHLERMRLEYDLDYLDQVTGGVETQLKAVGLL